MNRGCQGAKRVWIFCSTFRAGYKDRPDEESDKWTYLGAVEPNPVFHKHLCHHWLAEDVERTREQDAGAGEMIAVELMTQEAVRDAVVRGEMKHALALSALSRVFQIWPLPFIQDDPSTPQS